MNDAPPLIRLAGVTKTFGDNQALRGVDLDVAKGDSLVLIGGSGAGKTLLLKCIMSLIPHTSGSIEVDGRDVTTFRGDERIAFLDRIGMTFQLSLIHI